MELVEKISISEARAKLGELVNQVRYRGGGIMLTKNGEEVAAIVPAHLLTRWQEEEKRFLDSLRSIQEGFAEIYGELTEEEAEELAAQLIQESREARAREQQESANLEPVAAD